MSQTPTRMARRRERAREAGLCITCCKQKPGPGRSVCALCQAATVERTRRARQAKRSAAQSVPLSAAYEHAGDMAKGQHFYEGAAQQYQAALGISGSSAMVTSVDSETRLRISEKLVEVLWLSGDPSAAGAWHDNLSATYLTHSENNIKAVDVLIQTARRLWVASETEAALPVLTEAIRLARLRSDTKRLKKANVTMANVLVVLARYDEARKHLDAVGEISAHDNVALRVSYWMQKGLIAAAFGQEASAFESCDRAVKAAQDGLDNLHMTTAWSDYALVAMLLGRTELAKTCHERALLIARRNNIVWRIPHICLDYAGLLIRIGQQTLAHEYLLESLSYDAKAPLLDKLFASIGIPLALYVKDEATLAKCIRPHAIELAFMSGEPAWIGLTTSAFARLYTEQGCQAKAQALLHRAVNSMHNVMDAWDLPIEVARCGRVSDIPQARRLLEVRVAQPCADVATAYLRLFDAFAAQRSGYSDEALVQARDATKRFEALHLNAYADLARSILPSRQRSSREQVHQAKPFSSTETVLTEREREVAALVLKGLTSRAIAAELSISSHTVDSHVNSIMSRLGIHSRYQLTYVLAGPESIDSSVSSI